MEKRRIEGRLIARVMKILILAVFLVWVASLAVPRTVEAADGRYQVVAGTDEKAYLVDTATGAVWVLTHRTLATGREPIAIPYKFIKVSPRSANPFLEIEAIRDASLPPGSGKER
jgi:hypothetical protein